MDTTYQLHSVKGNIDSSFYRGLSYMDSKLFPVKHSKNIPEYYKNQSIVLVVRSGLTLSEVNETIKKAIDGEENDFTSHIGGSAIADDNSDIQYLVLVFFGMLLGLVIYKLFDIFTYHYY